LDIQVKCNNSFVYRKLVPCVYNIDIIG